MHPPSLTLRGHPLTAPTSSMNSPSRLLLSGLACLTLVSCAWLGKKKKPAPEAPSTQAKLVGRVASIPADRRFVLIQSYGKWEVQTGSVLVTRGSDDQSANLLFTGESLGQFAAADLQSGTLVVGDAVFFRPPPAKKSTSDDAILPQPTTQIPKNHTQSHPEPTDNKGQRKVFRK